MQMPKKQPTGPERTFRGAKKFNLKISQNNVSNIKSKGEKVAPAKKKGENPDSYNHTLKNTLSGFQYNSEKYRQPKKDQGPLKKSKCTLNSILGYRQSVLDTHTSQAPGFLSPRDQKKYVSFTIGEEDSGQKLDNSFEFIKKKLELKKILKNP